jgi:glutaminyl-peptide cyclotransferase
MIASERRTRRWFVSVRRLGSVVVLGACSMGVGPIADVGSAASNDVAPTQGYKVVAEYPRQAGCFTEGLQWIGSGFLESCGLTGASTARVIGLDGVTSKTVTVPPEAFAEGIVQIGTYAYQLTWRNGFAYVRDAKSLATVAKRPYPKGLLEGWGATTDGKSLIVSDGTAKISFLQTSDLSVRRSITVRNGGQPVEKLNELEWINGEIWANVWLTDQVVRINPTNGRVIAVIDLTGLRPPQTLSNNDAVLNGIAYDKAKKKIFVTGKFWDKVFEIVPV